MPIWKKQHWGDARHVCGVFALLFAAFASRADARPPKHAQATPPFQVNGPVLLADGKGSFKVPAQIYFRPGLAVVGEKNQRILRRLALALKAQPRAHKLRVEGHTNPDDGPRDTHAALAQKRALAVVDALVALGAERARLVPIAVGSTKPRHKNSETWGRIWNRRVEFAVVSEPVTVAKATPEPEPEPEPLKEPEKLAPDVVTTAAPTGGQFEAPKEEDEPEAPREPPPDVLTAAAEYAEPSIESPAEAPEPEPQPEPVAATEPPSEPEAEPAPEPPESDDSWKKNLKDPAWWKSLVTPARLMKAAPWGAAGAAAISSGLGGMYGLSALDTQKALAEEIRGNGKWESLRTQAEDQAFKADVAFATSVASAVASAWLFRRNQEAELEVQLEPVPEPTSVAAPAPAVKPVPVEPVPDAVLPPVPAPEPAPTLEPTPPAEPVPQPAPPTAPPGTVTAGGVTKVVPAWTWSGFPKLRIEAAPNILSPAL